jgi:hypothetical protein
MDFVNENSKDSIEMLCMVSQRLFSRLIACGSYLKEKAMGLLEPSHRPKREK